MAGSAKDHPAASFDGSLLLVSMVHVGLKCAPSASDRVKGAGVLLGCLAFQRWAGLSFNAWLGPAYRSEGPPVKLQATSDLNA